MNYPTKTTLGDLERFYVRKKQVLRVEIDRDLCGEDFGIYYADVDTVRVPKAVWDSLQEAVYETRQAIIDRLHVLDLSYLTLMKY